MIIMNKDFDTSTYADLLAQKSHKIRNLFAPFTQNEIEVFPSPVSHYRMRTEFRVWHEGEDLYYYMFDKVNNSKIRME